MRIVYDNNHDAHSPEFELYDGIKTPYPEVPQRAEAIISRLRRDGVNDVRSPRQFPARHILDIHQSEYVAFLRHKSRTAKVDEDLFPSYFLSDTYAPITKGTYTASLGAVNAALTGAELILKNGTAVYSLCRPPGHHAGHHAMGGYCYFNNAAIAANFLSQKSKVAILDIDFHHGNGTQEAFYDRSDVLYVSIHADPADNYPHISGFANETGRGVGLGYTVNYPVARETNDRQYLKVLNSALADIQDFSPDYLVVSAGFDTYHDDPIGGMGLSKSAFTTIGKKIANVGLPTLIIQEGGYKVDVLGELASNFLSNF